MAKKTKAKQTNAHSDSVQVGEESLHSLQNALRDRVIQRLDTKQIEEQLCSALRELAPTHVPRIAELLHSWWPDGFRRPQVRSSLRLCLQLDELSSAERVTLLRALLANEDRAWSWLLVEAAAPLGVRQSAAILCRAIALAAHSVGTLEELVPDDVIELILRAIRRLFGDRDLTVALPAAWAAGLLAMVHEPSNEWLMLRLRSARDAATARRLLCARAAQCLMQGGQEGIFLAELEVSTLTADPVTRAALISALAYAPEELSARSAEWVGLLLEDGGADAVSAALRFAHDMTDAQSTRTLARLCAGRISALRCQEDREIATWLKSDTSDLLRTLRAMRDANAISAVHGYSHAKSLLAGVHDALDSRPSLDPSQRDGLDRMLSKVLLDEPTLFDALRAGSKNSTERSRDQKRYHEALRRLRKAWIAEVELEGGPADLRREALRRLSRAIDAAPRNDLVSARSYGDEFLDATRDISARLLKQAQQQDLNPSTGANLRAYLRTLGLALDPLFGAGALLASDIVFLASLFSTARAIYELAEFVSSPRLAYALVTLARLRDLEPLPQKTTKKKFIEYHENKKQMLVDLWQSLEDLHVVSHDPMIEAISILASGEHPLPAASMSHASSLFLLAAENAYGRLQSSKPREIRRMFHWLIAS